MCWSLGQQGIFLMVVPYRHAIPYSRVVDRLWAAWSLSDLSVHAGCAWNGAAASICLPSPPSSASSENSPEASGAMSSRPASDAGS